MKNVLIVGCGDIGQRVALLAKQNADTVTGLVRSAESVNRLQQAGIHSIQLDLAEPQSLKGLPFEGTTIIYIAPPPSDGETDPLNRNFLQAIPSEARPEKMVLLSTTAVYGDCQGKWIDE